MIAFPTRTWAARSNENTNGLLRQYFPKGSDLGPHTAADLDWVAQELNDRPRKRLGYHKPIEESANYCCADRQNPPFDYRGHAADRRLVASVVISPRSRYRLARSGSG